ncbi:MAG: OmpA family protein [Sphingobacteriales bacterium]|nr:MAG: OmpA family protein [Sphingobacteriales bacterium]
MKKLLFVLLTVIACHAVSFGQDNDYKKMPAFGVHFSFFDFKSAAAVRSTSFSHAVRDKKFGKIKNMSPGLTVNYLNGLTNHFDLSASLAGTLVDYPFPFLANTDGSEKFLLEGDLSIHAKMFSDKHFFTPYLSAGLGISKAGPYWGTFIPMGVGAQMNLFDEAFILINSQYRVPISDNVAYHFYHSIGVAGNLGKKREPKVIPPPPPPPVEVPKDRDGDGIIDADDACPDVAGVAALKGCPDADKDGIADKDDKCPNQAGVARYQGCPIPDTDGDGINDENDKCPNQAGVARYNGCPIPDTDGDGVNDEEDKCPAVAGVVANQGCPEIKDDVKKKIAAAAKNINFATGSSKLLAVSNKSLNEVVKILNTDASLKLDISGHTDNTGKAEKNQALSESRAAAVLAYLKSKGIAEDRLKSAGFGQDQPVADNKTAAGRSKNRRVELKLHYD